MSNSTKKLAGKVAIVTASSRGIGKATANRLAQDGAAVTVNYVSSSDKADAVVEEIRQAGGRAIAIQANVAQKAEVEHLFSETEQQLGKINIVVNVAGIAIFKPHIDLTDEDFDNAFSVNARGSMYVLQAAAKHIQAGGRIVQLSTSGTAQPKSSCGLYTASKAAGERFALCLAKELGDCQITVNAISPGAVDTDGLTLGKDDINQLIQQTPLGRLGQPKDIADIVALLVSDEARWLTGQNIQVNGGLL